MRNPVQAKRMAVAHEGRTRYLYLDSEDKPTIGIGNYLPTVAAALALKTWTTGGRAASPLEVRALYAMISAEPAGYRAEHYASLSDLRISDGEIDSLWDRNLAQFEAGLVRVFPSFQRFPEGPQLGLFDIIYQAGEGGIKSGFPSLCKAVNANPPDWATAAKESHRKKSSDRRNADTAALFSSGVAHG